MSVTERMARFIVEARWEDFPALVVERAKKAVVDTVGVTLAGAREPLGRIVTDFAQGMGARPRRPSWERTRAPPRRWPLWPTAPWATPWTSTIRVTC